VHSTQSRPTVHEANAFVPQGTTHAYTNWIPDSSVARIDEALNPGALVQCAVSMQAA